MKIKLGTGSYSPLFLNPQTIRLYPPVLEKASERSWTWTLGEFAAYRRERHWRVCTKGCGPMSYETQVTLSARSVRSKQKWETKGGRWVLKLEEEDPVPLGAPKSFREKWNPTFKGSVWQTHDNLRLTHLEVGGLWLIHMHSQDPPHSEWWQRPINLKASARQRQFV